MVPQKFLMKMEVCIGSRVPSGPVSCGSLNPCWLVLPLVSVTWENGPVENDCLRRVDLAAGKCFSVLPRFKMTPSSHYLQTIVCAKRNKTVWLVPVHTGPSVSKSSCWTSWTIKKTHPCVFFHTLSCAQCLEPLPDGVCAKVTSRSPQGHLGPVASLLQGHDSPSGW